MTQAESTERRTGEKVEGLTCGVKLGSLVALFLGEVELQIKSLESGVVCQPAKRKERFAHWHWRVQNAGSQGAREGGGEG